MDKATKVAVKKYPHGTFDGELGDSLRAACAVGYMQAQKDLALTWEDIKRIDKILVNVRYEINNAGSYADIPWYFGDGVSEYEEALRRFNAERRKK